MNQSRPTPSIETSAERPRPNASEAIKPKPSTSELKLGNLDCAYSKFNTDGNVNIVLDLALLNTALSQAVLCSQCGDSNIEVRLVSNIGLACNLELFCTRPNCTFKHSFMSSNKLAVNTKLYEANVRLVYGL